MKIIITYASAGAGHFKAAQAVYNYFKEADQSLDLKFVDILDHCSGMFKLIYIKGYSLLINHFPWMWACLFGCTSSRFLWPLTNKLHLMINRLSIRSYARLICKENADLVISTHFLSSQMVSYLKQKGKIKSKLVTVITDFGVHPLWISAGTDSYVVASDITLKLLNGYGIASDKILPIGIPIDAKFNVELSRQALASKFLISADKFTVLILTGSFGLGPIEQIVSKLCSDIQLLVVCANNKRLFNNLVAANYPNTKIYGFVDNVEELMAVSDLIVTKPGGLSISELLAKELVPVFICPIPGQEEANASVMKDYGIGVSVSNAASLKEVLSIYRNDLSAMAQIKNKIRIIKRPFAAKELYSALRQSSYWVTS